MKYLILILFSIIFLSSCRKAGDQSSCYDPSIINDDPCSKDCPQIIGCDDQIYCNECVAAKHGIRPKQ